MSSVSERPSALVEYSPNNQTLLKIEKGGELLQAAEDAAVMNRVVLEAIGSGALLEEHAREMGIEGVDEFSAGFVKSKSSSTGTEIEKAGVINGHHVIWSSNDGTYGALTSFNRLAIAAVDASRYGVVYLSDPDPSKISDERLYEHINTFSIGVARINTAAPGDRTFRVPLITHQNYMNPNEVGLNTLRDWTRERILDVRALEICAPESSGN